MTSFWKPRNGCAKSELALFAERPVQTDIESSSYVKVYPLNNVQSSTGPIEFHIQGSADDYIDLDETKLCLRVKVVKTDGTDIDEADRVYPVNNWMHSLFSDVTCLLNETQVEGGTHMYSYKSYLSNLLLYGQQAKLCQLQPSGFYKDEAGKMNDNANKGFVARKTWIAESRSHDLVGSLHLDICQQGKLILNQVDIRLKLTHSNPSFNLVSLKPDEDTAAVAAKVQFEEAYLLVRRVKVSPDTIRQHETGLQLQNAVYPIQKTEMLTYTVASGSLSHIKENLFHGQLPKLLVLGLVYNEDFNGKSDTNPFNFQHMGVKHVGVYKDGMPIPHEAFTPNFAANLCAEEYMALMSALDLSTTDADIGLTKNEYMQGYTLFAFNLSPDKVIAGHGQPLQDGNLRVELKFNAALTKAINVVAMAIFDDQIEISRLRKVTLNG